MSDNESLSLNNIKLGDIVFSKLSNKPMIVEAIDDDNITCVWLKENSIKQEREIFKIHTLRKPNEKEEWSLKLAGLLPKR